MEITLLSIGKTKESWLEEGCAEYIKRLRPTLKVICSWLRDDEQLLSAAKQHKHIICLDPAGPLYTSENLALFLNQQLEIGGARLCMVIGGPCGLPAALKKNYPLLSLSPLTFTHQLTRLLFLEQLYRACEITRGSPYHK